MSRVPPLDTMPLVCEWDGLRLLRYEPTFLRPFFVDMEPTTLMRRFRFWLDLAYGYSVYYLARDRELLGYCTVTSGRNPRFWFAAPADVVVGPYFIAPSHRNRGYSTQLLSAVLQRAGFPWQKAWLYILNDNAPSIRVAQKNGARLLFHVHNTPFRRLVRTETGEYGIYEISRGDSPC